MVAELQGLERQPDACVTAPKKHRGCHHHHRHTTAPNHTARNDTTLRDRVDDVTICGEAADLASCGCRAYALRTTASGGVAVGAKSLVWWLALAYLLPVLFSCDDVVEPFSGGDLSDSVGFSRCCVYGLRCGSAVFWSGVTVFVGYPREHLLKGGALNLELWANTVVPTWIC